MKLTKRQRQVLEAVPIAPTQSASSYDIAESIGELTHWIASPMKALEKKGLIRCTKRGGLGLPSWWTVTDAGRLALKNQESDRG